MKQLFKRNGWNIKRVGIIKNLETLEYVNIELKELERIKLFKCKRNKKTNLVDYFCRLETLIHHTFLTLY